MVKLKKKWNSKFQKPRKYCCEDCWEKNQEKFVIIEKQFLVEVVL